MTTLPDRVARVVLQQFGKLPQKRKPSIRDNGLHEWVPLSGIVAERDGDLTCLALATGMKCLPASKLQESNGIGIHDWHAEILAIRTFNRYLLDECLRLLEEGSESYILRRMVDDGRESTEQMKPFQIREDVKLYMYCSEAPCGDGSMELTMAAQQDASPWESPESNKPMSETMTENSLPGRAFFSQLGIVRRKPARGDAPPTLSKSCSDKLALKQCVSLLSSLTSLFVEPANAYIHSVILPESQYSATACERAFSAEGRMKAAVGAEWPGGYSFNPFAIETTELEFDFSKRIAQSRAAKIAASNLAAAWSSSGFEENILGGVIQGRKAFDVRGASRMSRRSMWESALKLARRLGGDYPELPKFLGSATYTDVQNGPLLAQRRQVKDDVRETALAGWIRNSGGSSFSLE